MVSFPDAMETAKVIPLYMFKERHLNNYRPFILLLAFSECLEKLVYKCISTFIGGLNNNDITYETLREVTMPENIEEATSECFLI